MPLQPPMPPAQVAVAVPQAALVDVDFDLRRAPRPDPCASARGDEIVVCARRQTGKDRVVALPNLAPRAPKAEFGIVGALRGGASVQQADVAAGVTGSSVTVNVKLPF